MQLNGLTIGSISKVYLHMSVDITVHFTFTTVIITLPLPSLLAPTPCTKGESAGPPQLSQKPLPPRT